MIITVALTLAVVQGTVSVNLAVNRNGWDDSTLIFATILYRHGERTPLKPYPTDPYGREDWLVDWGQLTNVSIKYTI